MKTKIVKPAKPMEPRPDARPPIYSASALKMFEDAVGQRFTQLGAPIQPSVAIPAAVAVDAD